MISVRWYADTLGHSWPPLTSLIFEVNITHFRMKVRFRIVYRIFLSMILAISFINFKIAQFRTGVLFETHWDCYEHYCKLSTATKVQKRLGLGFGNTFHEVFKKKKQQYFIKINSRSAPIFGLDEARQLWVARQRKPGCLPFTGWTNQLNQTKRRF